MRPCIRCLVVVLLVLLTMHAKAQAQAPLPDCALAPSMLNPAGAIDPVRLLAASRVQISAAATTTSSNPAAETMLASCPMENSFATRQKCPGLFEVATVQKSAIGIPGLCVMRNLATPSATLVNEAKDTKLVLTGGTIDVTSLLLGAATPVAIVYASGTGPPVVDAASVSNDRKQVKLNNATIVGSDKTTMFWFVNDTLTSARVSAPSGGPPPPPSPPPPGTDTTGKDLSPENPGVIKACKLAHARQYTSKYNVLCYLADSKHITLVTPASDGPVMPPNRPIMVTVAHTTDVALTVTVDGDLGVGIPGILNMSGQDTNKIVAQADVEAKFPVPTVDTYTFGPRTPGRASVHVVGASGTPREVVTELLVETTYSGALRVGVAGVFGGAVDRSYSAQMRPGSGQAEIAATNVGDVDVEVVIGAAMFLDSGGRGYAVPGHNMRWAPYFGLGVINGTDNGLKLLRSVHLGLEYELNPHFSIALTGVARRITQLAKGFAVGDPVTTTVPTDTGIEFGVGLVVNLSPDFLRLATKAGTSFFGN